MKKHLLKIIIPLLSLAAGPAIAGSTGSGVILNFQVSKAYGDFVFIRLDNLNTDVYAPCHVNTFWNYTLPLVSDTDKQMFSMLLVAYSSGKSVELQGMSACNEFPAVESLRSVTLSH